MNGLHGRRVLVTGAAGFLGANLVPALLEHGAEVHALLRPTTDLWRLGEVLARLAVHRVELTDREGVRAAVRRVRPEVVFHLASSSEHHARTPEERWRGLESSVVATASLLEALEGVSLRRMVHLGSSLEYGPRDRPLRETDALAPVTHRGAVKAAATLLCTQRARAEGFPVVVLRAFSVYGPWEAPARLVPSAIRAALRGEELSLTPPGLRRDLVFVSDVVDACLRAAVADGAAGEVVNVGSGRQWSNEEVVEMVERVTGRPIRVGEAVYPPRASDTGHWVADVTRAERLLGWRPRHDLRSGLEALVAWYRSRPEALARAEARAGR